MSESIPERADVRQLRTQAKELLRSLQSGEVVAEGVSPATAKLADAQRLIARKHGFDSWPKLVDEVETPGLIAKFKTAVDGGDAPTIERLLRTHAVLRKRINEPVFDFDSPALLHAVNRSHSPDVLEVLVRYGADPNARSQWWAGSFGALDFARGAAFETLVRLGARFDIWSAASHSRLDILQELLAGDPTLVNARGGDGCGPLHFAANAEVAELLICHGADLELHDIDHEGTPVQHHIGNLEVLRALVKNGAKPDIFTAVALNDAGLVRQILSDDPEAVNARVGSGAFSTKKSDGGHIYLYKIGGNTMPHIYAAHLGHREVLAVLLDHLSPERRLVAAAWMEDAHEVAAILADNPGIGARMGADARAITDAAQHGKVETVRLLLEAGLDPNAPGLDAGTALHTACWYGQIEVVRLLLGRIPSDLQDPTHGSPPLGWAVHGAQHCRNEKGDYVAVVEALIAGGADPTAPANRYGTTMLAQAGSREDVKAVLRRHGAV